MHDGFPCQTAAISCFESTPSSLQVSAPWPDGSQEPSRNRSLQMWRASSLCLLTDHTSGTLFKSLTCKFAKILPEKILYQSLSLPKMEPSRAETLSPWSQGLTNVCHMEGGKCFSKGRENDIEGKLL